jgi:hypothetical protein
MKKDATPKCKRLKTKTFDEKRGSPKMQGTQNKYLPEKKDATPKRKGLITKTSDEKRANPKTQGVHTKDL